MTVLPVIVREMSVIARRRSMYWSRGGAALLALLVMFWVLLISSAGVPFARLGSSMFLILSSLCFAFAVLVGIQATADCISEEKREGTLGLLLLTDLKGLHVIGGKLAASSLHAVLVMIGVIPMLSLSLLLGGVTLAQFGKMAVVLLNTMFLSLSLGVFVSTLSKNERKAMMWTFAGLLLVIGGPIAAVAFASRYFTLPSEVVVVLLLSPFYAFTWVQKNLPAGGFWVSVGATHALAWLFLLAAAWVLPRCVNEAPSARLQRVQEFVNRFVYGRLEQRKRDRAELLDRNAFLWLASRERVKTKYAWGVLAFFLGLHAWIALQFDDMLFDLAVCSALIFLIHVVYKIWAASEVCSRLIQDRRSGALELLLSTPLSVREIADGQSLALQRIFFLPICALLLLEGASLYGGLNAPRQLSEAGMRVLLYVVLISTFFMDLWALKWVGLWLSLTGKSIEQVLLRTITRVMGLPWVIYLLVLTLAGTTMLTPRSNPGWFGLVGLWGLLGLAISMALGTFARQNFLTQFRRLAAGRFESAVEAEPLKRERKPAAVLPNRAVRSAWAGRKVPAALRKHPVAGAIVFVLAVSIFLVLRNEYWKYRIEAEIKAAREAGFPVNLSGASRYYPAPSSEQNAFTVLAEAGPPIWLSGPAPLRQQNARAQQWASMRRDLAEQVIGQNRRQTWALWQLPKYSRAHIDPFGPDPWGVDALHTAYSALGEAELRVSRGEMDERGVLNTELTVRSLLAQARLLRQQPMAIAQHAANNALQRLAAGLEHVLARDELSEGVLKALQEETQRTDDPAALVRTLALHRALFLAHPQIAPMPFPAGVIATVPPPSLMNRLKSGFGSENRLKARVLADYAKAIQIARLPNPERLNAAQFDARTVEYARAGLPGPGGGPFGYLPDVFWADAAFAAHLHLIQTALALERYERQHGKLPRNLSELVPVFLPFVPLDPYTGEPLRMDARGKELLVYSVGMDRADDTGSPTARRTGTDIVFTFR